MPEVGLISLSHYVKLEYVAVWLREAVKNAEEEKTGQCVHSSEPLAQFVFRNPNVLLLVKFIS